MTIAHKFLSSCLIKNDLSTFSSARKDWFDVKEKVAYDFILNYYRDAGELPPIDVFNDKFKFTDEVKGRPSYFFKELKNRYVVTSLTDIIPKMMSTLKDDPADALEKLQRKLSNLRTESHDSKDVSYADDAATRFDRYEERVATKGVVHLSTGVPVLDETMYGYRKADLITIGGRGGQGKTWLLIWLAIMLEQTELAKGNNKPILFISNEMPEDEIIERIDSLRFKLCYEDFMKGTLNRKDKKRYREGLEALAKEKSLLKIVYNCSTVEELNMYVEIYGPCAVFIDGSYLMDGDGEGWEKITNITRGLKRTAKNKSTPIINTTQLRGGTGKKEATMAVDAQDEFAYSKSYSLDSDIAYVMFQDPDMVFANEVGIQTAKGRRVKPNTKYIFTLNLVDMELSVKLEGEIAKPVTTW